MSQDHSAPEIERLLVRVSYHAVTRYVQRVMGVVVEGLPAGTSNKNEALAHCAAVNLNMKEVRRRIMTNHVALMLLSGFSRASTDEFTAEIDSRNQVIRTILPPILPCRTAQKKGAKQRKRCIDRSKRESAKLARLHARKNRGRPSAKLAPKELEP